MAFVLGKLKCYFCEGKDGIFHSVCEYGCYGDVGKRIFYHPECLEMVEAEPEKFGHREMDKALHVVYLRKECHRQCNSQIQQKFQEKVDKLNAAHFENMIPLKE